jgi:multicomponent Na+:H+ antiporter subunit B
VNSIILRAATRFMLPLLLLFAVFLLLRGHNDPGGGFSGGLVAASAFALYAFAYGVPEARRAVRVTPRNLIGVGLVTALGSGMVSLVLGKPFMTGVWMTPTVSGFGKLHIGTPLIFDVGVFLVVVGVALSIILALAEVE